MILIFFFFLGGGDFLAEFYVRLLARNRGYIETKGVVYTQLYIRKGVSLWHDG